MLGCDMSFTLAALNPCAETRTGSKSVPPPPLADDPPAPLKGLPVVWEKLHKGRYARRTPLHMFASCISWMCIIHGSVVRCKEPGIRKGIGSWGTASDPA